MGVGAKRAWLIDVYDTILSIDYESILVELAGLAGAQVASFLAAAERRSAAVGRGTLTLAGALAEILADCGLEPAPGLISELVVRDTALLTERAHLHEDALDLLRALRRAGRSVALVSNCGDNTRPMLEARGLADLVDAMVLSCEVGSAKPEPAIYLAALDRLGVAAADAVMIDDQPHFCRAARVLGMDAVRIVRNPDADQVKSVAPGVGMVSSLRELVDPPA